MSTPSAWPELMDSPPPPERPAPTYWLTRFVLLRLLGVVYAVAFLVAANQNGPLIGEHGLLPVGSYLDQVRNALGSTATAFFQLPSIFWFAHSDTALLVAAWIGFALACIVAAGFANALLLTVLWLLYMSFVHVGQDDWYGYGWEFQLLETGFLAIFLCPLLDARPFPQRAPPLQIIWLFRWLIFRIMLGAGLIKIRGDASWRNLTALYYHFETQPIPNPLSRWFHFLPRIVLRCGTFFTHVAELGAPWFVFWPRLARHIAGGVIIGFQCVLILSGNLSFLNWLTIVPALACFDDSFWSRVLPRALVRRAEQAAQSAQPSRLHENTAWVVVAIVALLSLQPVANMLSPSQVMNASFDPLDLVNTYGAFGYVGKERDNIIFEGTDADVPDDHAVWKPYPYKGLPVDLYRRPPQIAPYQLRLDWRMWFASMGTPAQYPWTLHLVWKLLHNDPGTLSLFASNPFPGKPPRYIRAAYYKYSFAPPGNPDGRWWNRQFLGLWLPPLSTDNPEFRRALADYGWIPPDAPAPAASAPATAPSP
ncbi:MAG: lipase maturation factor family protein [Opitutales bacterium]